MELNEREKKIWQQVKADLADEPVASTDHVERMTRWCQELGPAVDADIATTTSGNCA